MNYRMLLDDTTRTGWNLPEIYSGIRWSACFSTRSCGVLLPALVLAFDVRTVLEIGSGYGFITQVLAKALAANSGMQGLLISCDIFPSSCDCAREAGSHETGLHIVVKDDSTTCDWSLYLGDRRFDLVFIDGDHSYEGVAKDIRNADKFLKEGGLMMAHDYGPHEPGSMKAIDEWVKESGWSAIPIPGRHDEDSHEAILMRKVTRCPTE